MFLEGLPALSLGCVVCCALCGCHNILMEGKLQLVLWLGEGTFPGQIRLHRPGRAWSGYTRPDQAR